SRLLRHHDPSGTVTDNADQAKQRTYQPDYAHQRDVQVKVLGESQTNPRDLAPVAGTNQPGAGGHSRQPFSTVSAKVGIVRNLLSAVVAIHKSRLPRGIQRSR